MPDSTINWTVVRWVEDAQDVVFDKMISAGYSRPGGAHALFHVGADWQEAWENWYDGATDYGED